MQFEHFQFCNLQRRLHRTPIWQVCNYCCPGHRIDRTAPIFRAKTFRTKPTKQSEITLKRLTANDDGSDGDGVATLAVAATVCCCCCALKSQLLFN